MENVFYILAWKAAASRERGFTRGVGLTDPGLQRQFALVAFGQNMRQPNGGDPAPTQALLQSVTAQVVIYDAGRPSRCITSRKSGKSSLAIPGLYRYDWVRMHNWKARASLGEHPKARAFSGEHPSCSILNFIRRPAHDISPKIDRLDHCASRSCDAAIAGAFDGECGYRRSRQGFAGSNRGGYQLVH
jgi:hypothetical protein